MPVNFETSVPLGVIVAEVKRVTICWFAIVTKGHRVLRQIDLLSDNTLIFSLRFMFYMVLACSLLNLPLLAAFGANYSNTIYWIADILFSYISCLIFPTILFFSAKIFGGKGSIKECIVLFSFASAFMPIGSFFLIIPEWYIRKIFDEYSISKYEPFLNYLEFDEKILVIIATSVSIVIVIYILYFVSKSLNSIQRLTNIRFSMSLFVSFILIWIYCSYVSIPFNQMLDRLAFSNL